MFTIGCSARKKRVNHLCEADCEALTGAKIAIRVTPDLGLLRALNGDVMGMRNDG